MGAGDESPVEALNFAFSSASVNVVNPQPVWLRSSISVVPSTRLETTSSPRTSAVTAGPPVRITSISARGRPKIAGRSERRGSIQVTTTILGAGRSRVCWIVCFCIIAVRFQCFINDAHCIPPNGRAGPAKPVSKISLVRSNRLRCADYTGDAPAKQLDDGIGDTLVSGSRGILPALTANPAPGSQRRPDTKVLSIRSSNCPDLTPLFLCIQHIRIIPVCANEKIRRRTR